MAQIRHSISVRKPLSHSIKGNGGGTIVNAEWGKITGTITDQIDLIQYINEEIEDINIPTNLSELVNDEGFITSSALQPYAKKTEIPTKVSDLTNDAGFITNADIPTKTSDLTNDSGFITSSDVPTKTSDLTNDSGFIDSSALTDYAQKSDLNDYVEIDSLTSINVSEFVNDAGYLTSVSVPTKTSDLTNDSGYITKNVNNLTYYLTSSYIYNNYYDSSLVYTKDEVDALVQGGGAQEEVYWGSIHGLIDQQLDLVEYIYNVTSLRNFLTEVETMNITSLLNYYKKSEVYTKSEVDALIAGGGGGGIVSWGNIVGWINSQTDLINISSLTNYYTKTDSDARYLTSSSLTSVNISTFNNDSGYITSSVTNLTNYYKKTETYTKSEVDALVQGGGGGASTWGSITGTITNQTDLVNYIDGIVGDIDSILQTI